MSGAADRAPAVSVLVAARDAAATLPAALRSVARQDFADWECVVVDDHSVDGTRAVAEGFAARDPRFRVVAAPARGVVAARNAGLDCCRGRRIALFDADDLMHRRRLGRQLAALDAAPALDGVGCHVRYFPRAAVGPGRADYEAWLNAVTTPERVALDRFREMPLGHPTLLLDAGLLRRHGWRERGWPEDWDLLLRMLDGGARLGVVPERLHSWRLGPASLSATAPAYALEAFARCRAAFLAEQVLAGREDYVLWGYGSSGKTLRASLLEHGLAPSHVVEIHPSRIGQEVDGAPVVAPSALPGLRGRVVLVAVAVPQARRLIAAALDDLGFVEGADWWSAA
jgi:hypothetical protein